MIPDSPSSIQQSTINSLYDQIRGILEQARSSAYKSVNLIMLRSYWQIGCLIVEYEQKGEARAAYGKAVLEEISKRLTAEFGKGYSVQNLRYMRQFYLSFRKYHALRGESSSPETDVSLDMESEQKRHPLRGEMMPSRLRPELSWTHYRLLLRVENETARQWYMNEAADQNWSTRQLDRQIATQYYERLLASKEKEAVAHEAEEKLAAVEPDRFIRDPYVLEFLNLKDYPSLRESTLEQAIIDQLQHFLLELGRGFSFVARQKRMRFDDEDFYLDLVFYNFIFASKYMLYLPSEEELKQEIERERKRIEENIVTPDAGGER